MEILSYISLVLKKLLYTYVRCFDFIVDLTLRIEIYKLWKFGENLVQESGQKVIQKLSVLKRVYPGKIAMKRISNTSLSVQFNVISDFPSDTTTVLS